MKYIFLYLIIINYVGFSLFHLDKRRAIQSQQRISEKNLLTIAFFGGSAGALLAMTTFRHKTGKMSFKIQLYLIVFMQVMLYLFVFRK